MQVKRTWVDRIADFIAGRLNAQSSGYEPYTPSDPETLKRQLRPGDILLVEGNQKVSAAIKYLTQSTWSHASMFVGDALPVDPETGVRPQLVEVNLAEGCVGVPLKKYETYNTRICRAQGLTVEDQDKVVKYMVDNLGVAYDMRNVFDLARYLIPTPPVPTRWRRKMLAFGSGDPTRAICSSLIAKAFQSISYPILPDVKRIEDCVDSECQTYMQRELLHIRHSSLFVPRDFDLSPYFGIVKPTIEENFNFKTLNWHDGSEDQTEEV